MARNPQQVKMIARHLLREIPRTQQVEPRDLIAFAEDMSDFSDMLTGHLMRMAASQILSAVTDHERPRL